MPGKSGLTIDVKSAIGDFRKYDEVTQKRFRKVLAESAFDVKSKQWDILHQGVTSNPTGKWTGFLGDSLSPEKKGELTWEIGTSDRRVVYASWIEDGGKGGFKGYHYVRDSLKGMKRILTKRLKLAIERPV